MLRDLIEQYPLVADGEGPLCNTPSSPFGMRCDLARAYLGAAQPEEALRLIDTIPPHTNPDAELDRLAVDALLDVRDTSRHTAEDLYQALEARLGHPVERTPERGCL